MDTRNSSLQGFLSEGTLNNTLKQSEETFSLIFKHDPLAVGISCAGLIVLIIGIFAWWFFRSSPDEVFDPTCTFESAHGRPHSSTPNPSVQSFKVAIENCTRCRLCVIDEISTDTNDDARENIKTTDNLLHHNGTA